MLMITTMASTVQEKNIGHEEIFPGVGYILRPSGRADGGLAQRVLLGLALEACQWRYEDS